MRRHLVGDILEGSDARVEGAVGAAGLHVVENDEEPVQGPGGGADEDHPHPAHHHVAQVSADFVEQPRIADRRRVPIEQIR